MKTFSLPVPDGLELPDEASNGKSFDIVANCKLEDGMLVIEALEGIPVAPQKEGSDDSGEKESPPQKGFLAAIEERFNPPSD